MKATRPPPPNRKTRMTSTTRPATTRKPLHRLPPGRPLPRPLEMTATDEPADAAAPVAHHREA